MNTLTPEQHCIVIAPRKPLTVVRAGAGTGKTRVLVERVIHLLQADPKLRIAVLPFGRKVSQEIAGRLHRSGINTRGTRLHVGTLHALCLAHYRRTHHLEPHKVEVLDLAGLRAQTRVWEQLLRLAYSFGHRKPTEETDTRPVQWLEYVISTLPRHEAVAQQTGKDENLAHRLEIAKKYREIVERLNWYRDRGLPHLTTHLAYLWDARQAVEKTDLLRGYDVLISDEYQDMSPLQDALLRGLWKAGKRDFWIVGDTRQSIYGFQGGAPELMQELEQQANQRHSLTLNFRSGRHHLTLASAALPPEEVGDPWRTARLENGQLNVVEALDSNGIKEAARAFWEAFQKLEGPLERDRLVVLVRTQEDRRLMRSALCLRGADHTKQHRRLVTGVRYLAARLGLRDEPTHPFGLLLDPLDDVQEEGAEQWTRVSREEQWLNAAWECEIGWQALSEAARQDSSCNHVRLEEALDWWRVLDGEFETLCDGLRGDGARKIQGLKENVARRLKMVLGEPEHQMVRGGGMSWYESAQYVQTIHQAKGLEWDQVIFVARSEFDPDRGEMRRYGSNEVPPTPRSEGLREWVFTDHSHPEEARLRYVALSRARQTLVIVQTAQGEALGSPMQRVIVAYSALQSRSHLPDGPLRNMLLDQWANEPDERPAPFALRADERDFWNQGLQPIGTNEADAVAPTQRWRSMFITVER